MDLLIWNDPHPTRQHDGLVVAPVAVAMMQFETSKVARQVRPTELIVEGCSPEWALDHDGERRGHSGRLMWCIREIQVRDRKAGEAGAWLGPTACGALVSNLATGASGRAWKRTDGRGMVMSLGLEHRVQRHRLNHIRARFPGRGQEPVRRSALQNRSIVGISRQRAGKFADKDNLEIDFNKGKFIFNKIHETAI